MKNDVLILKNIKENKKFKIIIFIFFLFAMLIFLNVNKVYAADAKITITPKNPRVGDTITLKAEITGKDCYSIGFIKLDESSNLEYISMDSQKKASGTTPLTGFIQAKHKVKDEGDAWINVKLKVESAPLIKKELDTEKITSNTFEKKLEIKVVPKTTGVEEFTGKFEVTENGINIRPNPSTTYGPLGVINKGKEIEATGKKGEWYQFTYLDNDAYLHKDYLKAVKEEEEEVVEETDKVEPEIEKEEVHEEVKDPNVRDPKDYKDNTLTLVIIALIVGVGIISALIFLFKQGKEDKEEDNLKYGKQNIEEEENKIKDIFKKRNNKE